MGERLNDVFQVYYKDCKGDTHDIDGDVWDAYGNVWDAHGNIIKSATYYGFNGKLTGVPVKNIKYVSNDRGSGNGKKVEQCVSDQGNVIKKDEAVTGNLIVDCFDVI